MAGCLGKQRLQDEEAGNEGSMLPGQQHISHCIRVCGNQGDGEEQLPQATHHELVQFWVTQVDRDLTKGWTVMIAGTWTQSHRN